MPFSMVKLVDILGKETFSIIEKDKLENKTTNKNIRYGKEVSVIGKHSIYTSVFIVMYLLTIFTKDASVFLCFKNNGWLVKCTTISVTVCTSSTWGL